MASKRKRLNRQTLLVLGGVLGVETVAGIGVAMSIHTRKTGMEATLKGKESALANVRTVSASLPALQAQYVKMQAQVAFLEKSLPPAEYIPTLLGQVEETARQAGVAIGEFRPKPANNAAPAPTNGTAGATAGAAEGATQAQFDMTVVGSYGQIQSFLKSLTRFHKILALNSIKLQPANGVKMGASPQLTAGLTLTAFVMPPAPPALATDSAPPAPSPATVAAPGSTAVPAPAAKKQTASADGASSAANVQKGLAEASKVAAREGIITGQNTAPHSAARG